MRGLSYEPFCGVGILDNKLWLDVGCDKPEELHRQHERYEGHAAYRHNCSRYGGLKENHRYNLTIKAEKIGMIAVPLDMHLKIISR